MAKLKEKLKEIDPKMGLVTKGSRQKTDLELDDIEEAIDKLVEANCVPLILASSKMMLRAPRFWGKDKGEDISGVAAELKELKEWSTSPKPSPGAWPRFLRRPQHLEVHQREPGLNLKMRLK